MLLMRESLHEHANMLLRCVLDLDGGIDLLDVVLNRALQIKRCVERLWVLGFKSPQYALRGVVVVEEVRVAISAERGQVVAFP